MEGNLLAHAQQKQNTFLPLPDPLVGEGLDVQDGVESDLMW